MEFVLNPNEVDNNTQQPENSYGQGTGKEKQEGYSIYYDFIKFLKESDFLCYSCPSGPWSKHQVKMLKNLTDIVFKDLIIKDDDFKYWGKLKDKEEYKEFQKTVLKGLEIRPESGELWINIVTPNKDNKLANMGIQDYKQTIESKSHHCLTPSQTLNEPFPEKNQQVAPVSWIPNNEWFPKSVKDLTIDDICTMVPRHERRMLSLAIGRAIIGKGYEYTANGNYIPNHTFRSCCVILGEPGIGKSTFFEYLFNTLKKVGYDVSTFNDINSRFNMSEVATSDIIYKDDISSNPLAKFLQSETAKIIITSKGYLRCEEKGEDAIDIPPKGVLFINANEFNPRSIYSIDPGMADRVKIISTYTKSEIDSLSYNSELSYYPEKRIKQLAEKCNVSTTTIMLWYSRLCADYFYEIISEQTENKLYKEVSYLTINLRYTLRKDTTTQILSYLIFQVMLIEITSNESLIDWNNMKNKNISSINWGKLFKLIQSDNSIAFNTESINYLKSHYYSDENWLYSIHPYMGYSWLSLPHYKKVLNNAIQKDSTELEDPNLLETFFKELKPYDCTELQSDLGWLNKSWQKVSYDLDYLQELALDASVNLS